MKIVIPTQMRFHWIFHHQLTFGKMKHRNSKKQSVNFMKFPMWWAKAYKKPSSSISWIGVVWNKSRCLLSACSWVAVAIPQLQGHDFLLQMQWLQPVEPKMLKGKTCCPIIIAILNRDSTSSHGMEAFIESQQNMFFFGNPHPEFESKTNRFPAVLARGLQLLLTHCEVRVVPIG